MRLSLFFFLHLVAFVILIIVHPHAKADDNGWAIIEKDKNFIYMSKNGEFIHGDRIVLSLNYKDCDTVYHLFTFLTTKGDANIYQFENQNIPIKIIGTERICPMVILLNINPICESGSLNNSTKERNIP